MRRNDDLRCPPLAGVLEVCDDERRRQRRQTIGLVVVLLVEFVLVAAVAIAVGGCSRDLELDAAECHGELGCACESNDDCNAYGLGGHRGRCSLGWCTTACSVDDDCAELDGATCGPLAAAGVLECTLPCDELGELCELGECIGVAVDVEVALVCGGAP